MVLPHVSHSCPHCDGSLSVRLQSTFRWLSLPTFWVWTIGLYPDWTDGENFRKISIGWLISETTFKRSKRYSISEKLKSKCLQDIESLFGKVYTKEVKKESALAENKNNRRKSMSDLKKYEGVIPAFYACYDDQGEVSPERTRALVQYFIDKGVQGLYVNGSSGECIYQSVEDRKLILEEVMAVAKGKLTIIAHVACNNTKDSMELARHAESLGVDAIATIPPIYFRLPEYSVAKYWNDISSAAPNTDYVIYNIPQLAGVALTPSLYTEMLKNPRVIGVKNSSMPVQDIQTFVSLGGEDHIVFNGPDEQFLGGRLMGAKAGIGGTYGAMPELFLKLNQLIADKDLETARELQYAINAIIGKLTAAHGNMYGVIKEVLKINEGLNIGSVRSPLTPVTEDDRPVVEAAAALIRETKERFL